MATASTGTAVRPARWPVPQPRRALLPGRGPGPSRHQAFPSGWVSPAPGPLRPAPFFSVLYPLGLATAHDAPGVYVSLRNCQSPDWSSRPSVPPLPKGTSSLGLSLLPGSRSGTPEGSTCLLTQEMRGRSGSAPGHPRRPRCHPRRVTETFGGPQPLPASRTKPLRDSRPHWKQATREPCPDSRTTEL